MPNDDVERFEQPADGITINGEELADETPADETEGLPSTP